MTDQAMPEAGPSRCRSRPDPAPKRKKTRTLKSAHSSETKEGGPPPRRRRLPPPLPAKPAHGTNVKVNNSDGPLKPLQGVKTKRRDTTHPGYGREVVFVTRKVGLGALMGRCRSLVVDEGYRHLTLYAMSAAIPHALLLLHSLIDLLPFSSRAIWYDIKTGSEDCFDEVQPRTGGIGAIEEELPKLEKRIKSTIHIDIHIGSKPRPRKDPNLLLEPTSTPYVPPAASTGNPAVQMTGRPAAANATATNAGTGPAKRNRPSKRARMAALKAKNRGTGGGPGVASEAMDVDVDMNGNENEDGLSRETATERVIREEESMMNLDRGKGASGTASAAKEKAKAQATVAVAVAVAVAAPGEASRLQSREDGSLSDEEEEVEEVEEVEQR